MGTARVFQLAEVLLEGEGQRNRADSRYGHGGRRHDSPPRRAIAEENGRGWSLTKSTFSEECGRSVRRRPWLRRDVPGDGVQRLTLLLFLTHSGGTRRTSPVGCAAYNPRRCTVEV